LPAKKSFFINVASKGIVHPGAINVSSGIFIFCAAKRRCYEFFSTDIEIFVYVVRSRCLYLPNSPCYFARFFGRQNLSGTDVMIFKKSSKNLAKILAFFAQTTPSLCKNLIIASVFEKNTNFFVESWQNRSKSQEIMIITSTPRTQLFHERKNGHFFLFLCQ
jgi:hypothetical protein